MAYIPPDAKWYIATMVIQICLEGEDESAAHIESRLIRADSPEEAYSKALEVGHDQEVQYENTDDKTVSFVFRGLRNLLVIYEEFAHGSELLYEEYIGLSEQEIEAMLLPKDELEVFEPRTPMRGPNYRAKWIVEKLREEGISDQEIFGGDAGTD